MKVIILGGFLGAGKTTVLLQLARYLAKDGQVAIVENEIGSVGIDDKLIQKNTYKMQSLFSGCICCSISGELNNALTDINKEINPEWIIIESTGIAYPYKIKENILATFNAQVKIVSIFDAFRFRGLSVNMGDLFFGQLKEATLVLVNKIDLVDENLSREVYEEVKSRNSNAIIELVSAKDDLPSDLWRVLYE